jgi:hypothetical protein
VRVSGSSLDVNLAVLQNKTVRDTGMNGYTCDGTWKQLNISSVTTTFEHLPDNHSISVTADSVGQKAVITLPSRVLASAKFSAASHVHCTALAQYNSRG